MSAFTPYAPYRKQQKRNKIAAKSKPPKRQSCTLERLFQESHGEGVEEYATAFPYAKVIIFRRSRKGQRNFFHTHKASHTAAAASKVANATTHQPPMVIFAFCHLLNCASTGYATRTLSTLMSVSVVAL